MKDVAEIIIGKYAEVKGLDKEEARKRLLPILTEKLREREEFMERVAGLSKAIRLLEDAGKANASEQVQRITGSIMASMINLALAEERKRDPIEEGVEEAMNEIIKLKIIKKMIDSGEKYQMKILMERLDEIETRIRRMEAEGEDERLRALAERLNDLARRIEAIKPVPKGPKNVERMGPKAISNPFERLVKLGGQPEGRLEKTCCSVETERGLSREEVGRMIEGMRRELLEELSPEKVKMMLEGMGYKVIEPPRSWDEVKKLIEEGKERPYEETLDSKQIEVAKNLIERAIDSMASIFGPPISQYMKQVVTGGGDNEESKEQQRPQEEELQQS
jgi:hypothetical protein